MGENLWFSQNLLTYKDKQYHTDGYLRLSLSANTEDYKHYNSPSFNISITNNYQKSCNLNIQNAEDLIESFEMALKKLNGEVISVEKKYSKDTMVIFKILVDTSSGERVVSIELISNESDTTKVIVPLKPIFQSFLRRLRFFVENYDRLCSELLLESIKYDQIQNLNQICSLLKGLPNQLISSIPSKERIPDSGAPKQDSPGVTQLTLDNFEKFIGPDASNIKIAEIEDGKVEAKKSNIEIKSLFCEKFIAWDLTTLENKLSTYAIMHDKVNVLYRDLERDLNISGAITKIFTEDEFKSIAYLSGSFSSTMANANTIHGVPIPSGVPVFYVDLKNRNVNGNKLQLEELALDLFMFSGFIRSLRRRLESKLQGANDNKSIFYMNYRCLFDPLYFSFLMNMKKDVTIGAVMNRYIYFQQRGVFKNYEVLIRDYGLPAIEESDIKNFVEEFYMNIYGKMPHITQLHDNWFRDGEVKLPSKSSLTLEQIINEVIPVEVAIKMGLQITDKDVVTKFKQNNKVTDEIFSYMVGKQKVKKESIVKDKITTLFRYVEKFKVDLPEIYRDSFLEAIKALDTEQYNFSKNQFPLDEFDERFVKALYVWNPVHDPNMKSNFTHFSTLVDSEIMTKDSILAVTKNPVIESKVDDFLSLLSE